MSVMRMRNVIVFSTDYFSAMSVNNKKIVRINTGTGQVGETEGEKKKKIQGMKKNLGGGS